jgi:soluble lytic murein transglycosylase-like protein
VKKTLKFLRWAGIAIGICLAIYYFLALTYMILGASWVLLGALKAAIGTTAFVWLIWASLAFIAGFCLLFSLFSKIEEYYCFKSYKEFPEYYEAQHRLAGLWGTRATNRYFEWKQVIKHHRQVEEEEAKARVIRQREIAFMIAISREQVRGISQVGHEHLQDLTDPTDEEKAQ